MAQKLYSFPLYIKHRPNLVMNILSFLMNLGTWVWIAMNIRPEAGQVFLHYNILFGVDLVGSQYYQLFLVPLFGLVILLLNALIGWALFHKDRFVGYMLLGTAMICQFFVMIAGALLVFLNV